MKIASMTFCATLLTVSALAVPAHADDWLSRIDNAVSRVESTVTRTENTVNRADRTAERINSKLPERSMQEESVPEVKERATLANDIAPAAGTTTISAEDQEILERARQIEEDRILRQAEQIRARQGQASR